jgi:16S rRNA (guanine966-N2)-methyltransferase
MSLRVISGQFRRRRLLTPADDSTRPYTDRVRQIVFDRLRDKLPGSRVADIFAGVGTMGIESLSRGATSCVFFESNPAVHALLVNNLHTIAPQSRAICWKVDVRRTSFRPRGGEDCLPYSLIFFDPPYRGAEDLQPGRPLAFSLKRLARPELSSRDCLLVLRTPERFDLPSVAGWRVEDCWPLSSMLVWTLCLSEEPSPELNSAQTADGVDDDRDGGADKESCSIVSE